MRAEFKPVDRWLRPDIWLPVMTKSYYFAEKIKKLKVNSGYLKKKKQKNRLGNAIKNAHLKYTRMLEYAV